MWTEDELKQLSDIELDALYGASTFQFLLGQANGELAKQEQLRRANIAHAAARTRVAPKNGAKKKAH